MKVQEGDSKAVAFVLSLERIYGLDHNFVIKIAEIDKYDSEKMTNYKWDPMSKQDPGSKNFIQEIIYLVKKGNNTFLRINEYEILNSDIRSLLFMHAYSYQLSIMDFGKLKALENVKIKSPLEKATYSRMKLIYRDFGILRIKKPRELI